MRRNIFIVIVILAVTGGVIGLVLQEAHERWRVRACISQLSALKWALYDYHRKYNCYPVKLDHVAGVLPQKEYVIVPNTARQFVYHRPLHDRRRYNDTPLCWTPGCAFRKRYMVRCNSVAYMEEEEFLQLMRDRCIDPETGDQTGQSPSASSRKFKTTWIQQERTREEAKEAFRILSSAPEQEWYKCTLIIFDAGKDGADVCAKMLYSEKAEERALAKRIISCVITAEEGWHRYDLLIPLSIYDKYVKVAAENISCFIGDAKNPASTSFYMLEHFFLSEVWMYAAGAEHAQEVREHPLYIWCKKNLDKVSCGDGKKRQKEVAALWSAWAKKHATNFAKTLREYQRLVNNAKRNAQR